MRLSCISVRRAATILCIILTLASIASATKVNGTFKLPSGATPSSGGVRQMGTIAGTPVFGFVDFRPSDRLGNSPQAMICSGVTYIPHSIRGFIRGDGQLIDSTAALGLDLVPTIGCQPSKTFSQARIFLSRAGASSDVTWTEFKEIPDQPTADWGALPLAPPTAPIYQGYRQVLSNNVALPARTKLKINGTAAPCADDAANDITNCSFIGVGSASFTLENPDITDTGKFQWKPKSAVKVIRLSCNTDEGTVNVNFDLRTEATPNVAGSQLLATSLTCGQATSSTIVFSLADIPGASPVAIDITGKTGSPTVVRIFLDYQL